MWEIVHTRIKVWWGNGDAALKDDPRSPNERIQDREEI
jgi:hypothetical protein